MWPVRCSKYKNGKYFTIKRNGVQFDILIIVTGMLSSEQAGIFWVEYKSTLYIVVYVHM